MIIAETQDFWVIFKWDGINTHQAQSGQLGLTELLSHWLGPVYVVHRLDAPTRGILMLAKNPKFVGHFHDLLKNQQIQKSYLAVTSCPQDPYASGISVVHESFIRKLGRRWISEKKAIANSQTVLTLIKQSAWAYLWQANPVTGKTHQIRLHLSDRRMPILGDNLYGFTGWQKGPLMLLSHELKGPFGEFQIPVTRSLKRLNLWAWPWLVSFLWDWECYRYWKPIWDAPSVIISGYADSDIRCLWEWLGPVVIWHIFIEDSNIKERYPWEKWRQFLAWTVQKPVAIWWHEPTGIQRINPPLSDPTPTVTEKYWKVRLRLTSDRGHAGWYGDQRWNRFRVYQLAQGLKVLNLFGYTGGFTIAAAFAGARQVVHVDASSSALKWAQENWQLNQLAHVPVVWAQADAIQWLKQEVKRFPHSYDLIICDPPTFGRGPRGEIFRYEKELETLWDLCWKALRENGILLWSHHTHNPKTQEIWQKCLQKIPPGYKIFTGYQTPDRLRQPDWINSQTWWFVPQTMTWPNINQALSQCLSFEPSQHRHTPQF